MKEFPKVTFGFVNCNRLFYLKSCVESFIETTTDYPNKEIIIVDNASAEAGTDEYLKSLEDRGHIVYKQEARDPSNEYAKALNFIAENATGEFVAPIPADMQFVVKGGWLKEYVDLFQKHKNTIGCISFDAQRRVRNLSGSYSGAIGNGKMQFLFHFNRNPVMGAANCLFSKGMLREMYPWNIINESHEGGQDSETKMLHKVKEIIEKKGLSIYYTAPKIPVSIAIFNEEGATARIRDNKRYGKYFEPSDGIHYYNVYDFDDVMDRFKNSEYPTSIEEIAQSTGWTLPIDDSGNWIKSKGSVDIWEEL